MKAVTRFIKNKQYELLKIRLLAFCRKELEQAEGAFLHKTSDYGANYIFGVIDTYKSIIRFLEKQDDENSKNDRTCEAVNLQRLAKDD